VTSSFTSFFRERKEKKNKRKMDQLQENKIKQKKKNKRVNKKESRKGKVCVENQDREPIDCQWRPSLYRNCAGPAAAKEEGARKEMMYEELGQEKDKTDWASATRIKSNKNTGKKKRKS
jgi:hypothetical protein